MVIWKFPIKPGSFEIRAPFGLRFLSIGEQDNEPVFWACVKQKNEPMIYRLWALVSWMVPRYSR